MPKVYKAAEVCEIAGLQPYILRSWEKEFPRIGLQKSPDGPRLYRQSDVDQVLRIKQLVFGEGLTLAGARRRLEDGAAAPGAIEAEVLEVLGAEARARIAAVRNGLRSILDLLSKAPDSAAVTQPVAAKAAVAVPRKPNRSKAAPTSAQVAAKRRVLANRTRRDAKRKRASV